MRRKIARLVADLSQTSHRPVADASAIAATSPTIVSPFSTGYIFPNLVLSRTIDREIIRRCSPSSLGPSKIDLAMPATRVNFCNLVLIFNVNDCDRDHLQDL